MSLACLFMYSCVRESAVSVKEIGGEKLYICDVQKVNDSIVLPLSELIEELHVIKLDSAKAALIPGGAVMFTENYVGIKPWGQMPYKLYDKQGRYIRDIGAIGKGPNEYLNIYCCQLDEANDRVSASSPVRRRLMNSAKSKRRFC